MKKPTAKDVARAANVSVATVSLVLNEKGNISEETRERVKATAAKLGYTKRQSGGAIAIVGGGPNDPFTPHLLQVAAEYGFSLRHLKIPAPGEPLATWSPPKYTGVIVRGGQWDPGLLTRISRLYPTVLMGASIHDEHVDSVWVDNTEGIYRAVDYLFARGHRHVGFVNGPPDTITSWEKRIGFERALFTAVGDRHGTLVEAKSFHHQDGREAAIQLLERSPDITGIIAGEKSLGHSLMKVLAERQLCIPDDISVIVFHDSDLFESTDPPVTAIGLPQREIAQEVVSHLVRRVQHTKATGKRLLLKPHLIERNSVREIY